MSFLVILVQSFGYNKGFPIIRSPEGIRLNLEQALYWSVGPDSRTGAGGSFH